MDALQKAYDAVKKVQDRYNDPDAGPGSGSIVGYMALGSALKAIKKVAAEQGVDLS